MILVEIATFNPWMVSSFWALGVSHALNIAFPNDLLPEISSVLTLIIINAWSHALVGICETAALLNDVSFVLVVFIRWHIAQWETVLSTLSFLSFHLPLHSFYLVLKGGYLGVFVLNTTQQLVSVQVLVVFQWINLAWKLQISVLKPWNLLLHLLQNFDLIVLSLLRWRRRLVVFSLTSSVASFSSWMWSLQRLSGHDTSLTVMWISADIVLLLGTLSMSRLQHWHVLLWRNNLCWIVWIG